MERIELPLPEEMHKDIKAAWIITKPDGKLHIDLDFQEYVPMTNRKLMLFYISNAIIEDFENHENEEYHNLLDGISVGGKL